MTTLTVTARGQVTFRKDVLKHLGIQPGGKIRLHLLPDDERSCWPRSPRAPAERQGFLRGKTNGARLSIDDIADAIAEAGAAAGLSGIEHK